MNAGLVFGGPMNEQHIAAEGQTMQALVPQRINWSVSQPSDASIPIRTVYYRWERIGYNGDVWGCWVADGYPKHRITDTLNFILALCRLATGM